MRRVERDRAGTRRVPSFRAQRVRAIEYLPKDDLASTLLTASCDEKNSRVFRLGQWLGQFPLPRFKFPAQDEANSQAP